MLCFSDLIKIFQNLHFCLLDTFKIFASIFGISSKMCCFFVGFFYMFASAFIEEMNFNLQSELLNHIRLQNLLPYA